LRQVKEWRALVGVSVAGGAALRAIPVLARHASRANCTRGHSSTLGARASTKDSTRIGVVIVSSRNFQAPHFANQALVGSPGIPTLYNLKMTPCELQ
jgi:hypothetical protein